MSQKDLVVKMTINSKEFENGLQNAKQSVKQFDSQSGLSALTKKIGALGLAMKAVGVAKDTFIKGINSTEASADSAASSMRSLTKSYDAVIQALANGNTGFSLTIDNLANIAKNAKAAYEALDKLGTFQMWSTADRSIINAQIAEDRAIVNSKTASEEDKKAAQERITANTKRLEGLTQQYLDNTKNAQVAVLRDLGKATEEVTDEMLAHYVESWKKGTLEAEAAAFREQNSFVATRSFPMIAGDQVWQQEQQYDVWNSSQAQAQYQAMRSLINARETDEGWNEYFKLVKEEGQIRTEIANTINKANRASEKTLTTTKSTTTPKLPAEVGLTLDQQMQYLTGALQNEILNNDRLKDAMVIDFEIPEEEIFEPDTEELMNRVAEQMKLIQDRTKYAAAAMSSFGQAFGYAADIAGDNPFGNTLQALSGVTNAAISTASAMMALTGAETMEGVAEAFASAPPFMKLAMAGTALAGILSMMAAVKSSFAGSYASGGIVGGNSYTGDNLWARVNSGEMIIPYNDWHNSNAAGNVHFVIEGSQLKGVLDNYDKTVSL
jgi:hypothetical protein